MFGAYHFLIKFIELIKKMILILFRVSETSPVLAIEVFLVNSGFHVDGMKQVTISCLIVLVKILCADIVGIVLLVWNIPGLIVVIPVLNLAVHFVLF